MNLRLHNILQNCEEFNFCGLFLNWGSIPDIRGIYRERTFFSKVHRRTSIQTTFSEAEQNVVCSPYIIPQKIGAVDEIRGAGFIFIQREVSKQVVLVLSSSKKAKAGFIGSFTPLVHKLARNLNRKAVV